MGGYPNSGEVLSVLLTGHITIRQFLRKIRIENKLREGTTQQNAKLPRLHSLN